MNPTITSVTDRIIERSRASRETYMERCKAAIDKGPARAHLTCGNIAHVTAASGDDKLPIAQERGGNIGIITAFNDMLSAHQPFETYPDLIKQAARNVGGTCLLYTSPSPRDLSTSRMPSSA